MAIDQAKVTLITRNFNRMLQDFAEISPEIEFKDIVRAVAVRVVASALRRTKAASTSGIKRNHDQAQWTTLDGKKYRLDWYLKKDPLWHRIESKRKRSLDRKLSARGLSKRSWLHQAEQLGTSLEVPAYVRNANYEGRSYPENVSFSEKRGGANYALKIVNASPIVQLAGGRNALIFAMSGETRYFYTLLEKGAFKTAASRAAKYPGVYARPRSGAVV